MVDLLDYLHLFIKFLYFLQVFDNFSESFQQVIKKDLFMKQKGTDDKISKS